MTTVGRLDRHEAIATYRRNRDRSTQLFSLLVDEAYYARPITLRHPIVFYEGHLPAFSLNTLVKKALGRPGIDDELELLFARGIDPHEATSVDSPRSWPTRERVRAFVEAADALVLEALAHADLDVPGHPLLDRAEAVYTILEHEAMHQETLLYMWHRLPHEQKRAPTDYRPVTNGRAVEPEVLAVPEGPTRLGVRRNEVAFGWDNEFGPVEVIVDAFSIDRHNVTNAQFAEFVAQGGYTRRDLWDEADWAWVRGEAIHHPAFWERIEDAWYWRGMFESLPLPATWPVYVSHAEARAYARWHGRRLPTEAEYHRAAYEAPDQRPRRHPWGNDPPTPAHGVFDFASWEPHPVGSHPAGRSAWGVDDLLGNGWDWTSTVFGPFLGFAASPSYPEYSADFFDESHYVMKGASPATALELLRPTFRNWFRPRYPYVYATFRTVGASS
ncbi:MAG: SUMF1/EgtB/PvdO family nonheme iron enzyme [Acidobacteriota bacterium]